MSSKRLCDARREEEILRKVGKHKNCIALLKSYLDTECFIIVMEKCRCSLMNALGWILQSNHKCFLHTIKEMTTGVAHVHRRGIVHRDLKPDNFLLGGIDGSTVKLCDFGLADFAPRWGSKLQGTYGSPAYMSPEMASGKGHTLSTDLWSLGATIYVLIFGDLPIRPNTPKCGTAMKLALVLGDLEPTFTYASSRLVQRSAEFVNLVTSLLKRPPSLRCSAALALRTSPLGGSMKKLRNLFRCGGEMS